MGITIKSFDIGRADCFLIKIEEQGKYFNLLVDCGKKGLYSEIESELGNRRLNGIVATHVDDDHIIGLIELLKNVKQDIVSSNTFIIYNKYDESLISYRKGKILHETIKEQLGQKLLIKSYAGNYHRENKVIRRRNIVTELPVQILSKKQRMLRERSVLKRNTVYLTMLSPDIDALKKFMRNWSKNDQNGEITNQSSIAFLLEFNEKSILMLGDAYVSDACKELEKFRGLNRIDYIKIAHHGSIENNKGLTEIVERYQSKVATVTIPNIQDEEQKHPNRKLIEELKEVGCQLYTSTNYICNDLKDMIHYVKVKDEITI